MAKKFITHFPTLNYSVVAEPFDYDVEYVIYEIAQVIKGTPNEYLYKNDIDQFVPITEAEKRITGYVKWDGCSNWNLDQLNVMSHFCDRQGLINLGKILSECYDMTKELCRKWKGEDSKLDNPKNIQEIRQNVVSISEWLKVDAPGVKMDVADIDETIPADLAREFSYILLKSANIESPYSCPLCQS